MKVTVHGYRDTGYSSCSCGRSSLKPIYDLGELLLACQTKSAIDLPGITHNGEDKRVYPDRLEMEDGSGRSWNLYGHDSMQNPISIWIYALQTGKHGIITPIQ